MEAAPRYVEADPRTGGAQAVAEGWRNLSAIGARGLAITNNLNFGNPEKPDIMAQMAQSVLGMGDAARALDTPVVSGNVSLYNETDGRAILPCPVVGMVGTIDDIASAVGMAPTADGQALVVIGQDAAQDDGWLGVSLYARNLAGDPKPRRRRSIWRPNIATGFLCSSRLLPAASAPPMMFPTAALPLPSPKCAWPAASAPR